MKRFRLVREHEQELDRYTDLVQSLETALGQPSSAHGSDRMKDISGRAGGLYYRFVTNLSAKDVKLEISGCSREFAIEIAQRINAERLRREANQ